MVVGIGRVDRVRAAAMAYDHTVLAGTQGPTGHRKTDRVFDIAEREELPVVIFAEGGDGRPSDTDHPTVAALELMTFAAFARLRSLRLGIAAGFCFAGNAALFGMCDVTIGVAGASIGMGGPAMMMPRASAASRRRTSGRSRSTWQAVPSMWRPATTPTQFGWQSRSCATRRRFSCWGWWSSPKGCPA